VIDLQAGGDAAERTVGLGELLADPRQPFPGLGGGGTHA
jgi:hypothetical protein